MMMMVNDDASMCSSHKCLVMGNNMTKSNHNGQGNRVGRCIAIAADFDNSSRLMLVKVVGECVILLVLVLITVVFSWF